MKKFGFGILGIVIVAVIYYLSLGSAQLTDELKSVVDRELKTLQTKGFAIQDRKISEKGEHFEIVFDDTDKIRKYLKNQGASITKEESDSLKGMKVGIDLDYLKDSYSSISLDLYPTALPYAMTQTATSREDKEMLSKIDALFKEKIFLIHVDINKMLSGFKGYMKDIEQTFGDPGAQIEMLMHTMQFDGEIRDERITSVKQRLETLQIKAEEEMDIDLHGLESSYSVEGPSVYDTATAYSIEKVTFNERSQINMRMEKLEASSLIKMENNLAQSEVQSKVDMIEVTQMGQKNKISNLVFDMQVANLDIKSFEKLQQVDTMDQAQIDQVVQQILSKGLSINIPEFSIKKLTTQNKNLDGFNINAKVDIDKNLDLSALQINPMLALNAVKADLNLSFSQTLHTFISQQPQALIAMMMFQPIEENGNKLYRIKLENGSLSVNGVAMQ